MHIVSSVEIMQLHCLRDSRGPPEDEALGSVESVVLVRRANPAGGSQQVEKLERRKKPQGNLPRRVCPGFIRDRCRLDVGKRHGDLIVSIGSGHARTANLRSY